MHGRFFCGPNAKKSDALAKQQRKRPRADGQGADSGREDDAEEGQPGKGGRKKFTAAGKSGGKGKAEVAEGGKGKKFAVASKGRKLAETGKGGGKGKAEVAEGSKGKKYASKGKKGAGPSKGARGSKAPPAKRMRKVGISCLPILCRVSLTLQCRQHNLTDQPRKHYPPTSEIHPLIGHMLSLVGACIPNRPIRYCQS